MALVKGTNCGFVSAAPTVDPAESSIAIDTHSIAMLDTTSAGINTITEIGWYCDNATEEANFEVAIYSDNASTPDAVVGSISSTNAKGTTSGWKSATGLSISVSPNTNYWIAVQLDDTATTTNYNSKSSGGNSRKIKNAQTSLPSPWGSSDGSSTISLVGFYAVESSVASGSSRTKMEMLT